jgi:hypothetical protein
LLRILENDLILKHDTIWPHGLNHSLHIGTPVEVAEFRRSCLRHRWPPEYDTAARPEPDLDLDRLRRLIDAAPASDLAPSPSSLHASTPTAPVGSVSTNNGGGGGGARQADGSASRYANQEDGNAERLGIHRFGFLIYSIFFHAIRNLRPSCTRRWLRTVW